MRQAVKYFLPRLAISGALVFGLAYIFFVYPQQASHRTIVHHTQSVQAVDGALQKARERLKDLAPPQSITPAKPGARNYANRLNDAQGAFDATVPGIPGPVRNYKNDVHTARFNGIVEDRQYRDEIAQAHQVLSADKKFLAHQATVMLALANLLEYDPAADLAASDSQTLSQHLAAAQNGLAITIQRLNSAPRYDGDKAISLLAEYVNQIEAARGETAELVGKSDFSDQKQLFISTVKQTQNQIIANRNDFWIAESTRLLGPTNQAEVTLHFYLTRLQNI